MNEAENFEGKDISDLFRDVLSGTLAGIDFLDQSEEMAESGAVLSINIKASELPKGREATLCNFLKAWLEHGKVMTREILITGTEEEKKYLIDCGCANAFSSGVKFSKE